MVAKEENLGSTTLGLTKWVHAMFFVGTAVIGWLFYKVLYTTWTALNITFYAQVPPPSEPIAAVIGGGGAVALAIYLWRHPKVSKLALEIVTELSKVTWPTRKELSASTVVVIVFSMIAAVILALFDYFWAAMTDLIYM